MNPVDVVGGLAHGLTSQYTIKRELGRGAMGVVYLAWDVKHARMVAVKVINPELSAAIGRARFLREINIAATFNHPHILPLHDSDEMDGSLYYVMPYVEGESLRDLLAREKQLPVTQAIRIAKEVADALSYAHARGVIHRDVKPANIMLQSNHAVVADFGLAGMANTANPDRLTETGLSLGTPLYMSPEQAVGQRVDERSDIYSLGCVLFEMLAGDPPYTGTTPQAILAKKMFEPVPQIRILRDGVSIGVEQVLMKALRKHPADRFESAAEFCEALEAAELDHHVSSSPRFGQGTLRVERGAGDIEWISGETGRGFSLAKLIGISAAVLALVTLIGFVNTALYDVKMQMPTEYTPSRTDFPIIGVRALLPTVIMSFGIGLALWVLYYILRIALFALRGIPRVRTTSDSLMHTVLPIWQKTVGTAKPETIADVYLIASVLASFIIISFFTDVIYALSGDESTLPVLACRSDQHAYWIAFSALAALIALVGHRLLRYLRARRASYVSMARVRWGGVLLIVMLVLIETWPWRVLWLNDAPLARVNGERAYILLERGNDLVVYHAERRVTTLYHAEPPGFERTDSIGYVFEAEGPCRSSQ
jgi:serine/threonine protein kinase